MFFSTPYEKFKVGQQKKDDIKCFEGGPFGWSGGRIPEKRPPHLSPPLYTGFSRGVDFEK